MDDSPVVANDENSAGNVSLRNGPLDYSIRFAEAISRIFLRRSGSSRCGTRLETHAQKYG
jgi:hypothetical protein